VLLFVLAVSANDTLFLGKSVVLRAFWPVGEKRKNSFIEVAIA